MCLQVWAGFSQASCSLFPPAHSRPHQPAAQHICRTEGAACEGCRPADLVPWTQLLTSLNPSPLPHPACHTLPLPPASKTLLVTPCHCPASQTPLLGSAGSLARLANIDGKLPPLLPSCLAVAQPMPCSAPQHARCPTSALPLPINPPHDPAFLSTCLPFAYLPACLPASLFACLIACLQLTEPGRPNNDDPSSPPSSPGRATPPPTSTASAPSSASASAGAGSSVGPIQQKSPLAGRANMWNMLWAWSVKVGNTPGAAHASQTCRQHVPAPHVCVCACTCVLVCVCVRICVC